MTFSFLNTCVLALVDGCGAMEQSGRREGRFQMVEATGIFPSTPPPKAPTVCYGCLTIDMDAASFSPAGYNANFLEIPLPLPAPTAGTPIRELPYTHFTVLLDPARRLAISTSVNIDGDQLVDVDRGDPGREAASDEGWANPAHRRVGPAPRRTEGMVRRTRCS